MSQPIDGRLYRDPVALMQRLLAEWRLGRNAVFRFPERGGISFPPGDPKMLERDAARIAQIIVASTAAVVKQYRNPHQHFITKVQIRSGPEQTNPHNAAEPRPTKHTVDDDVDISMASESRNESSKMQQAVNSVLEPVNATLMQQSLARLKDLRCIAANAQLTTAQWKENEDEIDAAKLECERVMAVIVEGKANAMDKPVDTEMHGGTKVS